MIKSISRVVLFAAIATACGQVAAFEIQEADPYQWYSQNGTGNMHLVACDTKACMEGLTLSTWNDPVMHACQDGDPNTPETVHVEAVIPPQVANGQLETTFVLHCDVNDAHRVDITFDRPICDYSDDTDADFKCPTTTDTEQYGNLTSGGKCKTDKPCDIDTGNKKVYDEDYIGPGLIFTRTFHSYAPKSSSPFGSRWHHSYSDFADIDSGALIGIRTPDGYYMPMNTHTSGVSYSIGGIDVKAEHVGSEYVAHYPDGEVRFYDDTDGRLLRVEHVPDQVTTLTYNTNDQLETIEGPFGHTLELAYNSVTGKITTVTLPSNLDISYFYSAQTNGNYPLVTVNHPDKLDYKYHYEHTQLPDLVTGKSDLLNRRLTTYQYDANNRAIYSELEGGVGSSTLVYSANSTTVTDANSVVRTYNFSSSAFGHRKIESVTVDGNTRTITNESLATDSRRRPLTYTDEVGNVTTYGYDDFHRTSVKEATGTSLERTTTYEYWSNASPRVKKVISPSVKSGNSRTVTTTYNSSGLPSSITTSGYDPQGNSVSRSTSYTYNANGQVITIDGPISGTSDTTTLDYYNCTTGDECGQLKSVTDALGNVTTYDTYDSYGRITKFTDPNGMYVLIGYNGRYGPSYYVPQLPSGGYRSYKFYYHNTGLLRQVQMPTGLTLNYLYDDAHQLTSITDNKGNKVEYDYDDHGNRTDEDVFDSSSTLKRAIDTVYDARNRIDTINHGGFTTDLLFDAVGNLTDETDPNSASTDHNYDELNRLDQTIDAISGVINYGYDVNDNIVSVLTPNGANTTFEYDDLGNLLKEVSPDRGTTTYTHDTAGNILTKTDARGKVTTYAYDALYRLDLVTLDNSQTIDYVWDTAANGKGRLHKLIDSGGRIEWKYDSLGDVTERLQVIGTVSLNTKYLRNQYTGQLTRTILPSGKWIDYYYSGHLQNKIRADFVYILKDATYDPFGPVNGWTWWNNTTHSRNHDLRGLMSSHSLVTDTRTLSYDSAGNLATLDDLRHDLEFDYDDLNRVVDFDAAGLAPLTSQDFSYDGNGNRTSLTEGSLYYYSNQSNSNRLLSTTGPVAKTYTYDSAGNVLGDGVHTYTYNDEGRLSGVDSGAVTYEYNGQGQRVKKVNGSTTTLFVYDDDGFLLGEYSSTGSALIEHVYFQGIPVALIQGTNKYYVHTDHLGTPRAVSDGNTVVWRWESNPFGSDAAQEDPDGDMTTFTYNLRFPGQYYDDETGHHYNYFRTYDPSTGRYLESDPIGLAGGMNTYGYVGGNPLVRFDSRGLACNSRGCYPTEGERRAANSGDWAQYYNLACAGGDPYACNAGEVAANAASPGWRDTMMHATNEKLRKSLLRNLDDACMTEDEKWDETMDRLERIRQDLAKAHLDTLDSLGASPTNPANMTRQAVSDFHHEVFSRHGASSAEFGGDFVDRLGGQWFRNYVYDWCPYPSCAR